MAIETRPYHLKDAFPSISIADVGIPMEFVTGYEVEEGKVGAGIAVHARDLEERRRIVTDRYLRAGYITQDELQNGIYLDEYEEASIPIVAKIGTESAASLRIIPNIPGIGLPINNEENIQVYADWEEKIAQVPFEISQLAKSVNFYRDPRPTLALIRNYFAISRYLDVEDAAGVVDNRVKELLNGKYMGFGLPDIGPSVDYMGSSSTPIYININDVIESTRRTGNQALADFLDTGSAPGFEWYQGV